MPEGDSYRLAASRASPILLDRQILAVDGSAPAVRRHSAELLGSTVTAVRTIGKHLLVDFSSGHTLHIHLGMPGRVRAVRSQRATSGHGLRAALSTEAGTVTVYAAPTVEVGKTLAIERSLSRLGPDILSPEVDWDEIRARAGRYDPEATVSDFLLDQRVLAGVGNVYKCETLFLERLDPKRPVGSLSVDERLGLARRARSLMAANTQRPARSTTGRPGPSTWVHDRVGQPCRRCHDAVVTARLGSPPRLTYWCPTCQK